MQRQIFKYTSLDMKQHGVKKTATEVKTPRKNALYVVLKFTMIDLS